MVLSLFHNENKENKQENNHQTLRQEIFNSPLGMQRWERNDLH